MTKRKRTRQNNTQKTNTCATITQLKPRANSCVPEVCIAPIPLVAPFVLLFFLPDSILVFSEENICVITHY